MDVPFCPATLRIDSDAGGPSSDLCTLSLCFRRVPVTKLNHFILSFMYFYVLLKITTNNETMWLYAASLFVPCCMHLHSTLLRLCAGWLPICRPICRFPCKYDWMACPVIVSLSTHEPSQVIENVTAHMCGRADEQYTSFLKQIANRKTTLLKNLSWFHAHTEK